MTIPLTRSKGLTEVQQHKCLARVHAQHSLNLAEIRLRSLPKPSPFRPQPFFGKASRTSAPRHPHAARAPALGCSWSQKTAPACVKTAGSIKHCQVKQGELGGLSEQSPMHYCNTYLKKPTLSASSRQHLIKCVGLPGILSSC